MDEILNVIESVSEDFPIYSSIAHSLSLSSAHRPDMTEILLKRHKIASHPSILMREHAVNIIIMVDLTMCLSEYQQNEFSAYYNN